MAKRIPLKQNVPRFSQGRKNLDYYRLSQKSSTGKESRTKMFLFRESFQMGKESRTKIFIIRESYQTGKESRNKMFIIRESFQTGKESRTKMFIIRESFQTGKKSRTKMFIIRGLFHSVDKAWKSEKRVQNISHDHLNLKPSHWLFFVIHITCNILHVNLFIILIDNYNLKL